MYRNSPIISTVNFTNLDLTKVDFSGAIFCVNGYSNGVSRSDFSGCVFKNTNFTSAILSTAQLTGDGFHCTSISVDFSNLDLSSCIFDKAVLSQSGVGAYYGTKPYASSVNFEKTKLLGTSFKDSILASVGIASNGTGISSSAVDFSNLDLSGSDFTGAIMSVFGGGNGSYVSASVNMTGANLTNAKLDNINLSAHPTDTGVNFSNANLTNASLRGCSVSKMVQFDNATITNANFSNITGLTTTQLSQTLSYKNKDLSGVKFNGLDLTNWILREQNLQNTGFNGATLTGVNMRYADLRGSDLNNIVGSPKTLNTLWNDGVIKNFSMESADDNLTIRKYTPATSGGEMISAKISESDATVSGGATLKLDTGARLDVVNKKTLTIAIDGELIIDTSASDPTQIFVESLARSAIYGKLTVNITEELFENVEYKFDLISFEDGSIIDIPEECVSLTVLGENFGGSWSCVKNENTFSIIATQVPEPATIAAIFGALALGLAVYRRRK